MGCREEQGRSLSPRSHSYGPVLSVSCGGPRTSVTRSALVTTTREVKAHRINILGRADYKRKDLSLLIKLIQCELGGEACRMQSVLLLSLGLSLVGADNNFLTGANDVIAVEGEEGELRASPFSVQFGKKDIWLPRSGKLV